MRTALILVLAGTMIPAWSAARTAHLTVLLDFQGSHSERSIAEMKRESQSILQDSGLAIEWRMRSEVSDESFPDLVVVRFKGKCIFEPVGFLYDERGPLAFSYSSGAEVLPFSEVACDKVTSSVRSAMRGDDYAHADVLLGRALGRVVAHELVHMLSRSGAHGREGVAKPAISGAQLIAPEFRLSPEDLQRIQPR